VERVGNWKATDKKKKLAKMKAQLKQMGGVSEDCPLVLRRIRQTEVKKKKKKFQKGLFKRQINP